MNLSALLGKKLPKAEQIRQALAEAEADGREIMANLARLNERREAVLLDGMDARELDRLDEQLKQLARAQDRADLAQVRLKERLAEAEQAERQAEVDRVYDQAMAAQTQALDLYRGEFAVLVEKLAELAAGIVAAENEIHAANEQLTKVGDPRRVFNADAVIRAELLGAISSEDTRRLAGQRRSTCFASRKRIPTPKILSAAT